MSRIENSLFCDNCGVEITWAPKVVEGFHYCCQDCYDGYECSCAQRVELDDDDRRGQDQPISGISNTPY